jgi:uncharacterized protein (TIGR02444 family)
MSIATKGQSQGPEPEAADRLDNAFWRFSLAVYGRPGVPETLVGLQDALSVDVNVLLFSVYTALHRSEAVTTEDVARWEDAVRAWRDSSVIPLRVIRRRLKTAPDSVSPGWRHAVRAKVAEAELAAERIEQALLFSLFSPGAGTEKPTDPQAAIAAAIAAVLNASGAAGGDHLPDRAVLTEAVLSQL